MVIRTETVLEEGMAFGCLDGGGMLIDRESGEYVPAEQVIRDPLHIDKFDFLQEDHLGPLKATRTDVDEDETASESTNEEAGNQYHITPVTTFEMAAGEPAHALFEMHAGSEVDGYIPTSSRKGRWPEFKKRKKGHK